MLYRALRRVLFLVPAERIHTWVFAALRAGTAPRPLRRALTRWLAPHDPVLESTVFGVRFPGPMGLAAGFDKDGAGLNTWGALGFGYAEVGTVTAQAAAGQSAAADVPAARRPGAAQPAGLQQPRRRRAALRLARHTPDVPIGRQHRQDQASPPSDAVDDYRRARGWSARWRPTWWSTSARRTRRACATCRRVESLRPILTAVRAETRRRCWSRSHPDLADADIDDIADLAVELGLAGIVATNTTVPRRSGHPGVDELGPGGISGPPVARRSPEVLRRLYRRVGDRRC